ncbi:hypothetical protein Poli38472_010040 [Pythium oligandrum]|uniref:Membrane insertase YidC/Oxa/ALB C-terminal domain-containing protein n=1 Tax=Pythium oligandrum TaxID=41045 RepID=A0A8K1C8R4_PYTOL|nr:hypothetical protein Poli38472_010040 [Pythium oligandrum]|eukprot:TMW58481.1 hypothetical protein Poli38472_010040 [Pythium oligandrum]
MAMWRGSQRLLVSRTLSAHHALHASTPRFFRPAVCVGFAQQPRYYSSNGSEENGATVTTDAVFEQLEEAATMMVRDTDLLQATGAVASSGGPEAASGSSLAIVQAVQSLIEQIHSTTGLPWWATLAATGVVFRAAVFPFYVSQIKSTQRLVQAKADFTKVISAYRFARSFIPKSKMEEHVQAMRLGKRAYELVLKKYDTRPVQTVLGSLVHIPLFILVAYSARDMIRSGNFEGLETGGFWLWSNLKETDSSYVLPFIASSSVFLNLEVSRRTRSVFWSNMLQYFQFAPILAFPVIVTLPQGVFFYWIASSWSSLAQTLLMQNNAFRRRIGLPPRGALATAPKPLAKQSSPPKPSEAT